MNGQIQDLLVFYQSYSAYLHHLVRCSLLSSFLFTVFCVVSCIHLSVVLDTEFEAPEPKHKPSCDSVQIYTGVKYN